MAEAGFVLVPPVTVSPPVGMVLVTVWVAVTLTVTVQLPLSGIVPPLNATEPPLAAAVTVPPQVVAPAGVPVLVIPVGYVSVKAAAVMAEVVGLDKVMVMTDVAPAIMGDVPKALVIPGSPTDSLDDASLKPLPPLVEVMLAAEMVLV